MDPIQDLEIVQEFLIESNDNLTRLDQEMVELEQQPQNLELLRSIFRTIHTIKGTCGFLGYSRLERLTHVTESLLDALRNGDRELDSPLTTLILEAVDGVKRILHSIETENSEGPEFEHDVIERLRSALKGQPVVAAQSGTEPAWQIETVEVRPVAAASPPEPVAPKAASVADASLRVDIRLLDRLMDLVGELVLTRNQVLEYNTDKDDIPLSTVSQRLNLITAELQEGVMKTRMQQIGVIWNKLPRMVRDLATSVQKEISLEMDGTDTELDRAIIEAIKDPLTHIIRNSCDHGIETPAERMQQGKPAGGRLTLRAFHEGGQVNILISDDGAGIDPSRVKAKALERGLITAESSQRLSDRDAINLVFLPGFSTARAVTSISGRGVGMDVVKTSIERIGGTVDILSKAGKGTTVRMKIPLTLAIVPGLVIRSGGERFVIPQVSLHELIRLEGSEARSRIEYIHRTPVFRLRQSLIALVDLNQIFELTPQRESDELNIVILQAEGERFGLIVDSISDTQEIVVKPLGDQLNGVNCYAGATIMGDGKIALILDVAGLASRSGVFAASGDSSRAGLTSESASVAAADARTSLLLFRAGSFSRVAIALSRVARLEQIDATSVERAAGRSVVQYRNQVLPLVFVQELLEGGRDPTDELSVVVCRRGKSHVGLVVDEIMDIVEEEVTSRCGSDRPGLIGSAVVGGRVTDFLDLDNLGTQAPVSTPESLAQLERALSFTGSLDYQEVLQ